MPPQRPSGPSRVVELLVLAAILVVAAAIRLPGTKWSVQIEVDPITARIVHARALTSVSRKAGEHAMRAATRALVRARAGAGSAKGSGSGSGAKAAPPRKQKIRLIIETDESTFYRHFKRYPNYRHTYVNQTAMHAKLIEPLVHAVARAQGVPSRARRTTYFGYRIGRIAAMLAGLAFLALVFLGGRAFGLQTLFARTLATAALALSPLFSVYGHLFLADSPNLLWVWLGYYAFIRHAEAPHMRWAFVFALAAGFATSTKFSTTYLVIPGLALLIRSARPFSSAVMMTFVAGGAFWLGNGFNYGAIQLKRAVSFLKIVRAGSGISIDISTNLINQAVYFIVALGLPLAIVAAIASARGGVRAIGAAPRLRDWLRDTLSFVGFGFFGALRRRLGDAIGAHPRVVVGLALGAQFALFATSGVGGAFARHVMPFVPAVLFVAVRFIDGLSQLRGKRALRLAVVAGLCGYMLLLCLDGERGYYNDPRQRARHWLQKHRGKTRIFADFYAKEIVRGMKRVATIEWIGPSPVPTLYGDHYFVTHQATYGRYLLADSCKKIQHCLGGERARKFFVRLIDNAEPRYKLIKLIDPGYRMLEHKLLGRVVPTHPYPEVGAVRIYRATRKPTGLRK